MDLISREDAIEYLMTNMGWTDEDGYAVDDADEKRAHIEDLINGVPSVPAVPLEQLANWLAERYEPPYTLNDIDKLKALDFIQIKEIWLAALTKWMEEQDANRQWKSDCPD